MSSDLAPPPLSITIIGSGLGGLLAAFALSPHSTSITIFERRDSLSQKGSGVMLRPSASRILQSWGLSPDFDTVADNPDAVLLKDLQTGEVAMRNIAVDVSEFPDWGLPRQELQRILYERATSRPNVTIHFGATVEDVVDDGHEAKVTVRFGDGRIHTQYSSLVLAADGIRSRTRAKILSDLPSHLIEPVVSNTTLYGTSTTRDQVLSNSATAHFAEDAKLMVYMSRQRRIQSKGGCFVVARMAQKAGQFGCLFGINTGTNGDTDQKGLWDEDGDVEYVKRVLAQDGVCGELQAILDMSDNCDRWRLASMPDIPRWTNRSNGGRLVLLGDSAHAMEPNAAQGFSQIIEDVGVLETLLIHLRDTMVIEEITSHWEKLRKPRAERIKAYAAWNTRMFLGEPLAPTGGNDKRNVKSLKSIKPDMWASFHSSAFIKWAHDWDVVEEAQRYAEALRQGKLEDWRVQEEERRGSRKNVKASSKI